MTQQPAAPDPEVDPDLLWTGPLLETLARTRAEGSCEQQVRDLFTATGWSLVAERACSGSAYTCVADPAGEPLVANRAGRLYLARHDSGPWATLWLPGVRLLAGTPLLWRDAELKARNDWLANAVIEQARVAPTLADLLDGWVTVLSSDPDGIGQALARRLRPYDPAFVACSTILSAAHPEAAAVQLLAALGSWPGPGLRSGGQPLLGRVRDVEFVALCGLRQDLKEHLQRWLAEHASGHTPGHRDAVATRWASQVPRGRGLDGMPEVLPPVTAESWPGLVRLWARAQRLP